MMDFQQYFDSAKRASDLVEQGDHAQALTILQSLIESDLPDLDKAMMAMNIAIISEKLGRESDALAWYDYGIGLETPLMRFAVAEAKAAYLISKNRRPEALAIYQSLLPEPFLMLRDHDRLSTYARTLTTG